MFHQNQFSQYQQNIKNDNQLINNEDEENVKEKEKDYKEGDIFVIALKKNYISQYLLNFYKNEKNKQLDELLSDLVKFKLDRKDIELNNFKQTLYENLEKMIVEISCIRNKDVQFEKIQKLYLWFKDKIKTFEDLRKIQEKSYKEKGEIDDIDLLNEKKINEKEEEIIINKEEKNMKENLKHRNKVFLNEDMLKDYKRKHIENSYFSAVFPKSEREEENLSKKEKNMYKTLSSTSFKNYSHTGDLTTFYSTKNGKNSFTLKKDIGPIEQGYYSLFNSKDFPPLNRETKYSYSYNRPKYNYNTMIIENNIINNKIKKKKKKRTLDEIKEKMNKFGEDKAKYKESIINKYELKNIINKYCNMNEFQSSLLKKYNLKVPIKKLNPKIISKLKEKTQNENSVELVKNEKEESKESLFIVRDRSKRSYSQIIKPFNFPKEKSKIELDKIKNLDNNTNAVLEKDKEDIKIIKLKLKQPKEKIKKKYMKLKENYSDIPNDVIPNIFNKNPLFKQKFLYDKMCGIKFKKELDNKGETERDESESEYHNFYMSAYDFGNLKKFGNFKEINTEKKSNNNKSRNESISETFDTNKDNYLNFRKTMSSWKKNNFQKLYNRLTKEKDNFDNNIMNNPNHESKFISFKRKTDILQRKHNSLLNAMVNPIENSLYPQYFLPRNGSMLLKRSIQIEKKGKSKKKKK